MSEIYNPYTAPQSNVEPGEVAGRLPRPIAVNVALALIAIEVLLSLFALVYSSQIALRGGQGNFSSIFLLTQIAWPLIQLALLVWLCFAIARGRHWARVVLLVWSLVGALVLVTKIWTISKFSLGAMYLKSPFLIARMLLPVIQNCAAIYLLFAPARKWFASHRARQKQS